jgi:hypothetical protein
MRGVSTSNTGLRGDSTTGTAVRALSVSGRAINASSGAVGGPPTISAQLTSSAVGASTAIQGYVGADALPGAPGQTGVQGRCDISDGSTGVLGQSAHGYGVIGDTLDGFGVLGLGYYGVYGSGTAGVLGMSDGGAGVQGWAGLHTPPDPVDPVGVWAGADDAGVGLRVTGVAQFNRSGKVTFSAGQSSKKVIVPGRVTTSSFGLANLLTNRAGTYVQSVVATAADHSITIYLNKAVTASTACGWFVIG